MALVEFLTGATIEVDATSFGQNPFVPLATASQYAILENSTAHWAVETRPTPNFVRNIIVFEPATSFVPGPTSLKTPPAGVVDTIIVYNASGVPLVVISDLAPLGLTASAIIANPALIVSGSDLMLGSPGADVFFGGAGEDILDGDVGNDVLRGGAGSDFLIGWEGNDTLRGEAGDDILAGDAGADTMDGGDGLDFADYGEAPAGVQVYLDGSSANTGEAASDTLVSIERLSGSPFNDTLVGEGGANILLGGLGADVLVGRGGDDILGGGAGGDVLDGGAGIDAADYIDSVQSITVFLGGPQLNAGDAAGDTYVSIENVTGGDAADLIGGDAAANLLDGSLGNDWLIGSDGADTLQGGEGFDVLNGGAGGDQLIGGAGTDLAFYRDAPSGITASMANAAINTGVAAGDTYSSVENIWGSDFDDVLQGNADSGQVYGFDGNDILYGLEGDDVVYGGRGSDFQFSGAGADIFFYLRWDGDQFEGFDTIQDFTAGQERIFLSRFWFGFGGIAGPAAALTAANADFVTAGPATSTRPTIFWNAQTREVAFDPDGTGATGAVILATLQAGATLSLGDIWTA